MEWKLVQIGLFYLKQLGRALRKPHSAEIPNVATADIMNGSQTMDTYVLDYPLLVCETSTKCCRKPALYSDTEINDLCAPTPYNQYATMLVKNRTIAATAFLRYRWVRHTV